MKHLIVGPRANGGAGRQKSVFGSIRFPNRFAKVSVGAE
jgi:hypothetical protein